LYLPPPQEQPRRVCHHLSAFCAQTSVAPPYRWELELEFGRRPAACTKIGLRCSPNQTRQQAAAARSQCRAILSRATLSGGITTNFPQGRAPQARRPQRVSPIVSGPIQRVHATAAGRCHRPWTSSSDRDSRRGVLSRSKLAAICSPRSATERRPSPSCRLSVTTC
jgi:hypothetical protein